MKPFSPLVLIMLLILGIVACAPVTPAIEDPAPTPPPTSAEPFHPLTVQTGIEHIDQILAAVDSGDPQNLRVLIDFIDAECTHRQGLGGPPKCREAEEEGTPVEVLAFLSSEGHFLRKDEIENWQGIDVSGVYAVYEVNTAAVSSEQYYPVGEHVILFVTEVEDEAVALRIGESGIVRVDTVYAPLPENLNAMIEREASTLLLAPKS